jgi:hypothetical protein
MVILGLLNQQLFKLACEQKKLRFLRVLGLSGHLNFCNV